MGRKNAVEMGGGDVRDNKTALVELASLLEAIGCELEKSRLKSGSYRSVAGSCKV